MEKWPWLKCVHRFGYVASCIVCLQLLFLVYFGALDWKKRQDRRQETRMQQGPANERLGRLYTAETELTLLAKLPPLPSLAPDGVRLVATPSFGDINFAISLRRTELGADGLLVLAPTSDKSGPTGSVKFKLSTVAYKELTIRLDALASAWKGESGWWTDGTGIVFERVNDKGVTSAFGNSPKFHGKIGALVFDAVRPMTPQLTRFDSSWHPKNQ